MDIYSAVKKLEAPKSLKLSNATRCKGELRMTFRVIEEADGMIKGQIGLAT